MAIRNTMNRKPVYNVPVKTVINLQSDFRHKLLCDGPTFSMGDSCAFRCSFCYVESIMRKLPRVQEANQRGYEFVDTVIRRENALQILERQLRYANGNPKYPDPEDNRVIYSSPLVDVAANMELVRETIEACKLILKYTNWQIRLLSKSNLLKKVAEEIPEQDCMIYGFSTGTLDDGLARAFEQDCPLPSKRIEALHYLQDNGCRTFGMVCPSLPIPQGELEGDEDAYRRFSMEAMRAIRAEMCEHVWGEVINVRGESMKRTCNALSDAGYYDCAQELERVSSNRSEWEDYSRRTFLNHKRVLEDAGQLNKLRFLQYVKKSNHEWWKQYEDKGAVLLGKIAHG